MDKEANKQPDFKYMPRYPGILSTLNLNAPPGATGPVEQPFSPLFLRYVLGIRTYTPATTGLLFSLYYPLLPIIPSKLEEAVVNESESVSSDDKDISQVEEKCLETGEEWIVIDTDDTSFKRNEREDKNVSK
jgi:hypothetical protein